MRRIGLRSHLVIHNMRVPKSPPSAQLRSKAGPQAFAGVERDLRAKKTLVSSVDEDGVSASSVEALAVRIQSGDRAAQTELYNFLVHRYAQYYARRLGSQEIDDKIQESFLRALRPIQRGFLRDPKSLAGFVATISRRIVAAHIDEAIRSREEGSNRSLVYPNFPVPDPEELSITAERQRLVRKHLRALPTLDKEILIRAYILEQPRQEICSELSMTLTQYRLRKWRAKERLRTLLTQSMRRAELASLLRRTREKFSGF